MRTHRHRTVLLAMLVAALTLLSAGGAAAHGPDAGVGLGTLVVGKSLAGCDVDGAGLGLPLVNEGKTAFYDLSLHTDTVGHPQGALRICGGLAGATMQLGASCVSHSGYDGAGAWDMPEGPHPSSSLTIVAAGWKAGGGNSPVTGGLIPLTARYETSDGQTGTLLALLEVQGGAECLTKSTGTAAKSGGATHFGVAAVLALIPAVD